LLGIGRRVSVPFTTNAPEGRRGDNVKKSPRRIIAVEKKIRKLLQLPPCTCSMGLGCPEITLNMIGHPKEHEVSRILRAEFKKTKKGRAA
jgi:hypothetical protein